MTDDIRELNLDNLAEVTGGTSPVKPEMKNKILLRMKASITKNELTGQEVTTPVNAYCLSCGNPIDYLGQDRVDGGLTGQYICTNPSCKDYNVIKCNDEVRK